MLPFKALIDFDKHSPYQAEDCKLNERIYFMKKLIIILLVFIISGMIFTGNILSQTKFDEIELENGLEESRYERLALVIGAGKTKSPDLKDYNYPVEDAKYVSKILEEQGVFDIIYMGDDAKPELRPTRENIMSLLEDIEIFSSKGVIKTFVFYFTGRAERLDNDDYFITYNLDPTSNSTVARTALFVEDVMLRLSKIQENTKTMVVLDTGNINNTFDSYGLDDESLVRDQVKNIRLLYSKTERSEDEEEDDNPIRGMITPFFTKAITGFANNNDYGARNRLVSFNEVGRFISEAVDNWSLKRGYRQKAYMAYYRNDDMTLTRTERYPKESGDFVYITQPIISRISSTATIIEYETSHQSIGELYISTDIDFDMSTADISVINDITADGLKHRIEINHNLIDLRSKYYMKVYVTDLETDNMVSETITVEKNQLYNMLYQNFDNDYDKLFEQINYDLLNKDYNQAVEHTIDLYYMIRNYRNVLEDEVIDEFISVLDIDEEKFREIIEEIITINLKEADILLENDEFAESINAYNETLDMVTENGLENFALKELIQRKINRARKSIEAEQLINEADTLAKEGKYEQARILYNEALTIVKEVNPDALYVITQLEKKMNSLPRFSYVYVGITGGAYFNITEFDSVLPIVLADLNLRLNRNISIGFGVDFLNMDNFQNPYYSVPIDGFGVYYLNLDLFGKFSLFNTYGFTDINHELLLRTSILIDFSPQISALPFGIGGGLSSEYIIRFNELFGLSVNIRFWSVYRFEPAYFFSINFAGGLGLVFNF